MGFFDNLKSSLTETGQNLSQKAKDTTEIFRLTNLNKTKEKEIEKVIYQIGSTYYANYRDECVEKMPELAAQIKSLQDEIAADKEMIEKAGLGVVMANSTPVVVNIANEVTAGNNDEGVAKILQKHYKNINF